MKTANGIRIAKHKMEMLYNDSEKSADAADLLYVSDKDPGITRVVAGKAFRYHTDKGPVKDATVLKRINSLVLPPAWTDVWICSKANGHLQATGYDAMGRKQYKYHPRWNMVRDQTKFHHLNDFGKALPQIREQLQKDLRMQGLPERKVLATIVSLMECTCIRVGSSEYEKLYGSFGLTTLKDKHVTFHGGNIHFEFRGKKGVQHDIDLRSRKLANIVKQCRDIPGQQLFQYLDDNGHHHGVDSGMVNNYIREISGGNFTAKDFRTWAGTLHAIEAFTQLGYADTESAAKKNISTALDMVAEHLGNTRTVCKKYYVHPAIIEKYTNGTLGKALKDVISCSDATSLSDAEQALMDMLEHTNVQVIAA